MSLQFWLVQSPKRNRTHIKEYGARDYFCGIASGYGSQGADVLQGPLRTKEMKVCKNCIRVFKARRGVEP